MGISADGFVSTPEGVPAIALAAGFEPGVSHGYPEFIEGCNAVVMGRSTFVPALGSPDWPWPGLQVCVLTSSPLPAGTPDHVTAGPKGPADLLGQLRSRPSGGDVHLVGAPRTIRAFWELGAPDRLELVILPMLLGEGLPLSPTALPRYRSRCCAQTGPSPTAPPNSPTCPLDSTPVDGARSMRGQAGRRGHARPERWACSIRSQVGGPSRTVGVQHARA